MQDIKDFVKKKVHTYLYLKIGDIYLHTYQHEDFNLINHRDDAMTKLVVELGALPTKLYRVR